MNDHEKKIRLRTSFLLMSLGPLVGMAFSSLFSDVLSNILLFFSAGTMLLISFVLVGKVSLSISDLVFSVLTFPVWVGVMFFPAIVEKGKIPLYIFVCIFSVVQSVSAVILLLGESY